MKYFDTFTGIGGFTLAINNAYENNNRLDLQEQTPENIQESKSNVESLSSWKPNCVGYSEIDKYASSIYQRHYPNHKNYGDITKIVATELPDFDLLVGGFPCQAFSIAGKRGGFEDTRGTLFFDLARILRTKKPRLFVFENVKGLLSHDKGNTFKTIISMLDELGYDTQWQVLNSKNFGVPQNRERVFIVGHLRGTSRPEVFPIIQRSGILIEQLNEPRHSNNRLYGINGIAPTLNTMQGGNRQPKILKVGNIYPSNFESGNIYSPDGLSPTLKTANPIKGNDTNSGCPKILEEYGHDCSWGEQCPRFGPDNKYKIRRLTPTECERLQGFPDGWTEGVSDTQRYKCCGNAVTVNVVQAIMEKLLCY